MMDQRELFASRAEAFDIVLRGMMLSAWELNLPFSLLDRGVRGNGDDVAEITVHSWTVAGSDRDVVRVVYMVTSSARRVMLRWRNLPRRGEHVALPRRPPGDWSPRPGGWASANCGRYTFKAPKMSRWHARPPLGVQAGITDTNDDA